MSEIHALIIDDNSDNVGVLAQLLSMEGVSYTGVLDTRRLDAVLQKLARVDVIFLDLEMPNVDGYTLLQTIKSNPTLKTVPVVAYTVHVSEISTARKLGFHSFLGKPLDADRFPDHLARILRGEGVWAVH